MPMASRTTNSPLLGILVPADLVQQCGSWTLVIVFNFNVSCDRKISSTGYCQGESVRRGVTLSWIVRTVTMDGAYLRSFVIGSRLPKLLSDWVAHT